MPTNTSNVHQTQIVWKNVYFFTILHISALYGFYLVLTSAQLATTIFAYVMNLFGGFGITGGSHRLWSHKSYKVKTPLKILLIICNSAAFQDSAIDWTRDHRLHHKYTETDADPYNIKRGFFFAHIGWLLCKKHPEVKAKGKRIDISDLTSDPILVFQKKYYMILMVMCCFIIPTIIPMYFWGETLKNSLFVNLLRYCYTLNTTWLVNSAAHLIGNRPYDKCIWASENWWVALLTWGEGWHNYHHVFPWDYRTAELGGFRFNFTRSVLDFFWMIGWAYDFKDVSQEMVKRRACRTGDGSHKLFVKK